MLFKRPKTNNKNNYGLGVSTESLESMAQRIAEAINGKGEYANRVAKFLVEIAQVETNCGQYWDKTKYAGMGITQIDKIAFIDVKKRTKRSVKETVLNEFGIDIDFMEWIELRHNPFLGLLVARLFLLLKKGDIPETIEGRAAYWKKHYNSSKGKGSEQKYLASTAILYDRKARIV